MMSRHTDDLGGAEGIEAVDECDADVDFGGLSTARQGIAQQWPERGSGSLAAMRAPKAFHSALLSRRFPR